MYTCSNDTLVYFEYSDSHCSIVNANYTLPTDCQFGYKYKCESGPTPPYPSPSLSPITTPTSQGSLLFTCAPYSTANTSSAQSGYITCLYTLNTVDQATVTGTIITIITIIIMIVICIISNTTTISSISMFILFWRYLFEGLY